VPVLQVGQLISEESDELELGLKNDEKRRLGFLALHLGQLSLDPSSPMDWRTSNFSPHFIHWYS
jgi:hypothetical protein